MRKMYENPWTSGSVGLLRKSSPTASVIVHTANQSLAKCVFTQDTVRSKRVRPPDFIRSWHATPELRELFFWRHSAPLELGRYGKEDWIQILPESFSGYSISSSLHPYNKVVYDAFAGNSKTRLREEADNRIIDRLLTAKANIPVDVVELGKTMLMARDFSQGLVNIIRSANSYGNPLRNAVRVADAMVSLDLMYKYGVKPLSASFCGVVEYLQDKFISGVFYQDRFIGDPIRVSKTINNYGTHTFTGERQIKTVYDWKVKDNSLRKLDLLGLRDLTTTAYELVPLSFVLDWFLPVGDHLARIGADLSNIEVWRCHTIRTSGDISSNYLGQYDYTARKCSLSNASPVGYDEKSRTVHGPTIAPSFHLRKEIFDKSSKLVTSLEILRTLRNGGDNLWRASARKPKTRKPSPDGWSGAL